MEQTLVVQFDDDPIRFTPEGKVFVLDAMKAVIQSEHPKDIWECLNKKNPKILAHCENRRFQRGQRLLVIDKEGWEMLWILLIDHLTNAAF